MVTSRRLLGGALKLTAVLAITALATYLAWAVIPVGVLLVFLAFFGLVVFVARTFGMAEHQNRIQAQQLRELSSAHRIVYDAARDALTLRMEALGLYESIRRLEVSHGETRQLLDQMIQRLGALQPQGQPFYPPVALMSISPLGSPSAGQPAVASPLASHQAGATAPPMQAGMGSAADPASNPDAAI